jgi:hypothetical protein
MARHALLIATGRYTDQSFRRLRSSAQDVKRLAEILRDPAIGYFDDVRMCVDQPENELRVAVEEILSDRLRDDLVLIYLSCHGVQDRHGRLYFATTNTRLDRLAATALAATFVDEQLSHSMAGGRVLILDCCFSGSFARGLTVKSSVSRPLAGKIGRGYFVLTATDAFEYAFEGESPRGIKLQLSVFTEAIIAGLESGLADRDGDGWVSAHDLYDYVYGVVKQTATQTPTYFASNVEGELLLARVPQTAQPSTAHKAGIPPVQGTRATTRAARRLSLRARWRVAVLAILLLATMGLVAISPTSQSPTDSYARVTSGEPILNDSLHDNSAGNHWYEGRGKFGECKFGEGAYHALPAGRGYHVCCGADGGLENLAVQVEMTIDSGDEGGIKFRDNGNRAGYFFHITKEGNYKIFILGPETGSTIYLSRSDKPNPAIKVGVNQSNMLAVLAQGPTIQLYANGQHLDTVQDTTFTAGGIGVCAKNFSESSDVTFNNIKVWRA